MKKLSITIGILLFSLIIFGIFAYIILDINIIEIIKIFFASMFTK